MLYTSNFLYPENIAFDANNNHTFSWQYNGSLTQVNYRLEIQLNSDNSSIYDSGAVVSSNNEATISALTLTNGNEYKWRITVSDGTDTVSSSWVLFSTNTTPIITINALPNPFIYQNYTITATPAQLESVPLQQFKVILYDYLDNVLIDSGWIYNTDISYYLNGLDNYATYKIDCFGVFLNGMTASSGKTTFFTNYVCPDDIPAIAITYPSEGSTRLDWADIFQILGEVHGSYEFINGFSITYDTQADFLQGTTENVNVTVDGTLELDGTEGVYYSNIIDVAVVDRLKASKIRWSSQTNSYTNVSVYTKVSLDCGATYTAWELCTNDKPIPNFELYDDISDAKVQFKIIFTSCDILNIPKLFNITLEINSAVLHLFDGSYVQYTKNIPEVFTAVYFIKLPSTFTGVMAEFNQTNHNYKVGYDGERFYFQKDYRLTASIPRPIPTTDFRIGIKPNQAVIFTDDYIEIIR